MEAMSTRHALEVNGKVRCAPSERSHPESRPLASGPKFRSHAWIGEDGVVEERSLCDFTRLRVNHSTPSFVLCHLEANAFQGGPVVGQAK